MLCFTTESSGRQEEAGFLPVVLRGPVWSLILFPGELLHGKSDSHSAISLAPGRVLGQKIQPCPRVIHLYVSQFSSVGQ